MQDLIYDAYSVFFQILQLFAPDFLGEPEFLLVGYTFACLFLVIVVLTLLQMLSAFTRAILSWLTKG